MADDADTPVADAPPVEQPAPETPPDPAWAHVPDAPPPLIEATKGGNCKTCKSKITPYDGTNPAKVDTGFCEVCGTRQVLKG